MTQAIGRLANQLGIEAILVHSARLPKGSNLIILPRGLKRRGGIKIYDRAKLTP